MSTINPRISMLIADSAHDAGPFYSLLADYLIIPIIDLNHDIKLDTSTSIDSDGTPLCQARHRMVYWGLEQKRNRTIWRCHKKTGI